MWGKRLIFWFILIGLPLGVGLSLGVTFWPLLTQQVSRAILQQIPAYQLYRSLPEEERRAVADKMANALEGPWNPDPDPLIARRLKPHQKLTVESTEVIANNEGMASSQPYRRKGEAFRIVVLGDSVAMGTLVTEEERLGDRMEQMLRDGGVRVEGRPVEVLTLALPSWGTVTQARYLTTRLSDYQPDIVLLLMVKNDIQVTYGVNGNGHATASFSPETRDLGSGYVTPRNPDRFGAPYSAASLRGMGPRGREAWDKAARHLLRLEGLLEQEEGRMLVTLLRSNPAFVAMALSVFEQAGLKSPVLLSKYQMDPENVHTFDPHPSPRGHRVLAVHQLHALAELGWLPLDRQTLPELHPELDLEMDRNPSPDALHAELERIYGKDLLPAVDFRKGVQPATSVGLVGGFWPVSKKTRNSAPPDASLLSGLLLRRQAEATQLHAEIQVPARAELYPFEVVLQVNGEEVDRLSLASKAEAGRHSLSGPLLPNPVHEGAVEVFFQANNSYSRLEDPAMRSFSLLRVWQD